MRRPSRKPQGFSLIEAAVAIAVIAILASAAAPLVMKALNQQREQTTRDNLKIAFEAMFGAPDRRVANMRADFGFNPGPMADLRQMTTCSPINLPLFGQVGGTQFFWGWNGPYWRGSTRTVVGTNGVPVDAWGRPIILDFLGGNSWQLRSLGADGLPSTDDIRYPSSAMTVSALNSTMIVSVYVCQNVGGRLNPVKVQDGSTIVVTRPNSGPQPIVTTITQRSLVPIVSIDNWSSQFPAGPLQVTVKIANPNPTSPNPQTQVVDLASGEVRTLNFNFVIP